MGDSRLFGKDRIVDLDKWITRIFENPEEMGAHAIWGQDERPPDPKGWRVRQIVERLPENHRKVLEETFFLNIPISEQARERKCSRAAVQQLLGRAKRSFVRELAKSGKELVAVPEEEL